MRSMELCCFKCIDKEIMLKNNSCIKKMLLFIISLMDLFISTVQSIWIIFTIDLSALTRKNSVLVLCQKWSMALISVLKLYNPYLPGLKSLSKLFIQSCRRWFIFHTATSFLIDGKLQAYHYSITFSMTKVQMNSTISDFYWWTCNAISTVKLILLWTHL